MNRSSANPDPDRPRLLITAGPTHEPIDHVRYVGNRSSGRMGIALAEQAAARCWPTTLLLGPTQLMPVSSSHLNVVRFQTAAELHELLLDHWPKHDVLIMAAAVADYRPVFPRESDGRVDELPGKLRRTERTVTVTLEPTPDLLASLAEQTRDEQTVIGFALEPSDRLIASATEKLARKKLDAIVANPLETMDATEIAATVLLRGGRQLAAPPASTKTIFANWLLDQLGSMKTSVDR